MTPMTAMRLQTTKGEMTHIDGGGLSYGGLLKLATIVGPGGFHSKTKKGKKEWKISLTY